MNTVNAKVTIFPLKKSGAQVKHVAKQDTWTEITVPFPSWSP